MPAYAGPQAAAGIEPDDDAMHRFLGWWFSACNRGQIEIIAVDPRYGAPTRWERFDIFDVSQAARRAAEANMVPGANIYFRAATVSVTEPNSATYDRDVVQIPGCWADCDDEASANHAWAFDAFPPAARIVTGRTPALRAQFWWKLTEPMIVPDWARQLNRQVHAQFGGDPAVVNPSRMMRLPGSISWPYKPGRIPEIVEWVGPAPGPSVTLDAARRAFPAVPDESATMPNASSSSSTELLNPVRALIDQIKSGNSWHNNTLSLVGHLVARGTPDPVIMALAPTLTLPGWTPEQTQADLRQMIDGAMRKGFAPGDASCASSSEDDSDVMNVAPQELDPTAITSALSARAWASLQIQKSDRLLGELIVPASRTFLVGSTGIGKTLLGYELIGGMTSGAGFLHWTCDRPSRWVILDGEMPDSLIKQRIAEVLGRHAIPDDNLTLYSVTDSERIQAETGLPPMPPLNTGEGHAWVMRLAEALNPDGILFDNLMSLSPGNHAEPDTWLKTAPLVMAVTKAGMAQIWCDHTGWDRERQYGTTTKAWTFDTVGILKAQEDRAPGTLAFNLNFDPPYGKARRRSPSNWKDFKSVNMTLQDGVWTAAAPTSKGVSPTYAAWLKDIAPIFQIPGVAEERTVNEWGENRVRLTISRSQLRDWLRKCGRLGDGEPESHAPLTDNERSQLRDVLNKLRIARKIGVDREYIWLA